MRISPALLAAAALCLAVPRASAIGAPRIAHTTTLLPTGDVLIAGGSNFLTVGGALSSAELYQASKGLSYINLPAMSVARASATATVMPNGMVLIAGGINGGGAIGTAEVYDPAARAFQAPVALPHARFNHTATLLLDGTVLLCGGQSAVANGNELASCDFYTPNGATAPSGAPCVTPAGCTSSSPQSMSSARTLHTATLLKDGKVLLAGGFNSSVLATNGWLTTMEKFSLAGGGSFGSAANLFEARAYHTATLMGDGKVLFSGGFNGHEVAGNRGILDTQEIYDPIADAMTPAPQMNARREAQSAVLSADGNVIYFGGLGNVTTTYLAASSIHISSAYITDSFSGQLSTGDMTTANGNSINFPNGAFLGTGVVGTIVEGAVIYSTPTLNFGTGVAYFVPGDPANAGNGLQLNLAGLHVGCKTAGAAPIGNCGYIDPSFSIPINNLNQGKIFFSPLIGTSITGLGTTGTIKFPGPLDMTSTPAPISPGSTIIASISIPMPANTIGATISSMTIDFKSGSYTQVSSYTLVITSADASIAGGGEIMSDGGTGAVINLNNITIKDINGTIAWQASTSTYILPPPPYSCPGGVCSIDIPPDSGDPSNPITLSGNIKYVVNQVQILNQDIVVDVSTIIIHSMVLGSPEYFTPSINATSLTPPTPPGALLPAPPAIGVNYTYARFGQTATLMPDNDMFMVGGLDCSAPTNAVPNPIGVCGDLRAQEDNLVFFGSAGFPRSDVTYLFKNNNSLTMGSLINARALHTATLLPNGRGILIAGGTNGPNILNSAEVYNPVTNTSAVVGTMRDDRDLHSATLLADGRVLIAGGFTTNATSSDSTNGAEIFYPETGIFIPTAYLNTARRAHTATLMPDGNVMVVGGLTTNGVITPTAELFFSTAQTWVNLPSMVALPHGARTQHTATLLKDGRLLVIGGTDSSGPLVANYAFTPSAGGGGTWSASGAIADLPHALYAHTATLLFDGRVLVAGGNDGFGEYNASYIYDPVANSWTHTDPNFPTSEFPLLQPRFGHTATLLPNDTVMISGGSTRFGIVPTEIEVFHVNASSWTAGGVHFADGARAFHTMTLATDGNVYAIGGSNGLIGGAGTSLFNKVDASYFTTNADLYTKNAPPSFRQSSIATATPPVLQTGAGNNLTVTGFQFRGGTEASGGGAGAANSSFSFPHLLLQQVDGSGGGSSQSNSGFVLDLTTQVYLNSGNYQNLDSSLTVALPTVASQLPYGWYNARVGANDLYSNGVFVQSGPQKPAAAPASISVTIDGISSFTWTWAQVPGGPGVVDGYNIYESSGGVFLGTAPQSGSPTFVQNNLPPNSTEQIVVAAYTISGDGPLQYSATSYTLSTSPISVSIASVTFSTLLLQWDPNGNTPGTVFEVSQSTTGLFGTETSTPVPTSLGLTTSSATIGGLQNSTTYYLRVRAFNGAGVPSGFSAVVSTLTRTSVGGLSCGPPPNGTNSSGDTPTSIPWTWSAPPGLGVSAYNIYNATTGLQIAQVAAPPFHDIGLGVNTQRSIQVSAVTGAGEGPLSPSATCFTLAAVPGQGSPLITSTETTSVSINWTANGNPNGTIYDANFIAYPSSFTTTVTTVNTTGLTAYYGAANPLQANALGPSQYYTAYVYAINGAGFANTPLFMGTTFTNPALPNPITIVNTTPVSISFSWNQNATSTMTYYQVTYSSVDAFVTSWSTGVPFSSKFNGSSATLSGLLTATTYWIRVQGENQIGVLSAGFSNVVATITFNGGAAPGSLQGTLTALGVSDFSGNLGNGRFVDLRSPGGAFPSDTAVTISSYSLTDPGHVSCPNAITGAPAGTGVGFYITDSPAFQPNHPLFLTGTFSLPELGTSPTSQVALARFDPASGTCVPLQTTINTASNPPTFIAELNHFSIYQLEAVPLATTADTARIYPNPFRASTDGYITVDQIPPAARVRVFTLRGEKILDASANGAGNVTWTGDNGAGRPVASGLYLVVIEAGGTKKIMKVAVIR